MERHTLVWSVELIIDHFHITYTISLHSTFLFVIDLILLIWVTFHECTWDITKSNQPNVNLLKVFKYQSTYVHRLIAHKLCVENESYKNHPGR